MFSEFYITCIGDVVLVLCTTSFMFANTVVDSCSTCIRQGIFSLMSRLNASTNVIVQMSFNS